MKKTSAGRRKSRAERVFEGVGVASGISIGTAHVVDVGGLQVPEFSVPSRALPDEVRRLEHALDTSRRQLRRLQAKASSLPANAAEDIKLLLDAYLQMLSGSRLQRGAERRIRALHINAEAAVQAEISEIARGFESLPDPYMAARAGDVREAGLRVIRNLTHKPDRTFPPLPAGTVIIAEDVSPAETALMDPEIVAGFATVLGGAQSHTAIMARSLGIPAVIGAPDLLHGIDTGDEVIVDGITGHVIVNPGSATRVAYQGRARKLKAQRRRLARLKDVPAVTRDDNPITLQANVELPREVDLAREAGAQGIGLLRTEFMFMNRDMPPGEDEQFEMLSELVRSMEGKPVTVRTLDVGGEKLAYSLQEEVGHSVNPALGVRAIRLSLKQPRLLEDQLAAILRAGHFGPVRILLPMIATVGEVQQVRKELKRVARRLVRRGVPFADPLPPLGVMIEVPGAALAADALAAVSDFFAIGTNDLTMYTLAIDRADEQVAHLYNPLHPAVLRLIQFSVHAGLRARIPCSVCGEVAGDPRYTVLLLGLGVRELSMAATALPAIKQRIRKLDLSAATMRAQIIMEQADSERIAALLDDLNALA